MHIYNVYMGQRLIDARNRASEWLRIIILSYVLASMYNVYKHETMSNFSKRHMEYNRLIYRLESVM